MKNQKIYNLLREKYKALDVAADRFPSGWILLGRGFCSLPEPDIEWAGACRDCPFVGECYSEIFANLSGVGADDLRGIPAGQLVDLLDCKYGDRLYPDCDLVREGIDRWIDDQEVLYGLANVSVGDLAYAGDDEAIEALGGDEYEERI